MRSDMEKVLAEVAQEDRAVAKDIARHEALPLLEAKVYPDERVFWLERLTLIDDPNGEAPTSPPPLSTGLTDELAKLAHLREQRRGAAPTRGRVWASPTGPSSTRPTDPAGPFGIRTTSPSSSLRRWPSVVPRDTRGYCPTR